MSPEEIRDYYASIFTAYRKKFDRLPSARKVIQVLEIFRSEKDEETQFLFEQFKPLTARDALIMSQILASAARDEEAEEARAAKKGKKNEKEEGA